MTTTAAAAPALEYLFHPRSIAIAGVSAQENVQKMSGNIFLNSLIEIGYRGPIYIIHPAAGAIRGIKCYRSLRDVPDQVDYCISSVPARHVPQLLEDAALKGVKVLHLYTAGFTETGDQERAKMEQSIVRRARELGVRLIGPNCMGLYVPSERISFMPDQPGEAGNVGMISQSGMNGGEFVRYATPRGIRLSKVISFGNGADLRAADFFDYFADDPETEIVVAYLEGIQDGPRMATALRRLAAKKPVAILKGGRTEAGTRAAASHTASLAGSLDVFDALCRQAGAIRVESMDDLVDMAVTFRFVRRLRGPNAVVVGGGGGASVLAADDLDSAGMQLPPLRPETQAELAKVTHEAGTSIRNPVDSSSMWQPESFTATLMPCAMAPNYDFVLFHTGFGGGQAANLRELSRMLPAQVRVLAKIQEESGKPVVVAIRQATKANAFQLTMDYQELCAEAGLASYIGVDCAGRALGRLLEWQRLHEG